mmetsp:Transcript_45066/g.105273  ORF Transcript_45066/g.105273 Transcript_45066/m.105273 type:complete len:212 (-) Transcript_45066:124-759(-)
MRDALSHLVLSCCVSSFMILGPISPVPVTTHAMRKYQTAVHPPKFCSGPITMSPKAAVIEPEPLMMPVTVESERVLPPMDGCSARSAATAEVMMLLGPPTKMPMTPRSARSSIGGIESENMANTHSRGARSSMKVAMTQARRPSYRSDTQPTITPPGIMPTEYSDEIRFALCAKPVCRDPCQARCQARHKASARCQAKRAALSSLKKRGGK